MTPNDMTNGDDTQSITLPPSIITSLGQTSYDLSGQKRAKILKSLRDRGIEIVFPLPKIVAIGNQSAGKSALIEAISQIKVPRDTGTCTRCPMEVNLIKGPPDQWNAKVSLRIEHAHIQGQKLGVVEFGETTEVEEVTILLRQAQLAILNPDKDLDYFANMSEGECKKHNDSSKFGFSRNTIVLQITGAETDIMFIDLPGIIASPSNEEGFHLVKLIHQMLDFYISQKECLILLTITMRDDIENQSAYSIAKKHDPHGARTFGVLTKADTVPQGEQEPWLRVFNDKTHQLQRGWYMTRLADTINRDQPRDVTLKNEFEFFQRKQPWAKLDKSRKGTRALTEALSSALSQMIEETLPELKKDIFAQLRKVNDDLERLPKSFADNPQPHLLRLCSEFIGKVEAYTSGNPGKVIFLRNARPIYSEFEEEIRGTRPAFTIDPVVAPPTAASHSPFRGFDFSQSSTPGSAGATTAKKEEISLHTVREFISETRTRELEGITPYSVHEYFIEKFMSDWKDICLVYFKRIQTILKSKVEDMCKGHFDRFSRSALCYEAISVMNSILERISKRTQEKLIESCKMENHRPFTMNGTYLQTKNDNFYSCLATRRGPDGDMKFDDGNLTVVDIYKKQVYIQKTEKFLLDTLSAYGVHISSAKKLMRIHEDEFEAEMEVVAHVLTYFDIASKRLIDGVPMIFETVFAKGFSVELEKNLIVDLNLVGEGALANCARYVKDDPNIQTRRNELERKQEILHEAARMVDHFFR